MLTMLCAVAMTWCLPVAPASAQATEKSGDPVFSGTWELAIGDSTFSGNPTMISRTMDIESSDDTVRQEIKTVTNRYETLTVVYEAALDGTDHPASGLSAFTNIAMRRIDDRTIERLGKVQGQVLETCRMSVSRDGKTLTLDITGPTYSSTQVYRRQ
jgi:hypothetical protein